MNPYLVGEIMMAPTWWIFIASSNLNSLSTIGMRNANVLPLPVTAYRILSLVWLRTVEEHLYLDHDVFMRHEQRYCGGLYRRHPFESHVGYGM